VNVRDVEDALVGIQSGGSSLEKAYDKTMKMIESQDRGFRKLAMHTLAWVAFSSAPLIVQELQHALAIEPGNNDLNFDNITKLEIILSTCAGLITIQNQWRGRTIHLVHETTQEYFDRTREKWFGNLRPRLARLSLTYLTFQIFESGPCEDLSELGSRTAKYPLYDYLGYHLSEYINGNDEDARVKPLLGKFLLRGGFLAAYMQTRPRFFRCSPGSTALHLAIHCRIHSFLPVTIHTGPMKCNGEGHSPLTLAIKTKFYKGIQYLLSVPEADCNATAGMGKTALTLACTEGDETSVRLLLNCNRIDCNLVDRIGQTPISCAMEGGLLGILQALLERKDFDCNLSDANGMTPLIWCIKHRHLQTTLLLLSKEGVDLTLPNGTEPGPLIRAARWGQPAVIGAMLAKSSSTIAAEDDTHRTALDHATECRNWNAVEQLLARYKKKIRIKHRFEDTALFHAVKHGSPERVSLVLNQVRVDKSWWFNDALFLSLENNRFENFRILKMKQEVWMRNDLRSAILCLLRAVEKGRDHTLNTLLQHVKHSTEGMKEEDVLIQNDRTWNDISDYMALLEIPSGQMGISNSVDQIILKVSARRGDAVATRILFMIGADLDATDTTGCTASEVIRMLVVFKSRMEKSLASSLYHDQSRDGG
jgi:ankyrin repeat protein